MLGELNPQDYTDLDYSRPVTPAEGANPDARPRVLRAHVLRANCTGQNVSILGQRMKFRSGLHRGG